MKQYVSLLLALMILCAPTSVTRPNAPAQMKRSSKQPPTLPLEQRTRQLNELLAEHWEYTMRTSPELASILGDKRYNDRLTDFSQTAIDRDLRQARAFLKKFEAIDPTGF